MFGKIICWVLEQVKKIHEAKAELRESVESARLERESNKILDDKLKYLKAKIKRDKIRDKIEELEEDEYEEDNTSTQTHGDEPLEDTLIRQLIGNVLNKISTSSSNNSTTPLEFGSSPQNQMTPEVINIIKKAKSHKELIPLAKKYFPTFDEDTIKTIWESFR